MPYDENGQHDNICYFCNKPIPRYEQMGAIISAGFVPPTPARKPGAQITKEEKLHVEFNQGPLGMTATAREERCCVPCYLVEFARVYPGAKLPRMPRPVDDDTDAHELPRATGTTIIASAGDPIGEAERVVDVLAPREDR